MHIYLWFILNAHKNAKTRKKVILLDVDGPVLKGFLYTFHRNTNSPF